MKRILAAACTATLLASCNGGAEDGTAAAGAFVSAHNTQQLMEFVLEPQAQTYWKAVQYISDETGEHDIFPQNEEDWLRARSAAATVTEMGNLLMTPMFAEGRGEDWMTYSKALVDAGIKAEKAAADQDVDAVFTEGGTVYSVCRACHQKYVGEVAPPPVVPDEGTIPAE